MIRARLIFGCLLAAVSTTSRAQDTTASWSIQATAGAVSDYRFRGLSLSGGDPAIQAGATVSHVSGLYGDVFVSEIEAYGVDVDGEGATTEITLTAGWSGEAAGYLFDLGVAAYRYPGGTDVNYIEFPLSAERAIGPVTLSAGFSWTPAQAALGDENNRYLWSGVALTPDGWPVSFSATMGHEDGAYAPDGKTDWSTGVTAPLGPVALSLSWIDSDADEGQVVGSVFVTF